MQVKVKCPHCGRVTELDSSKIPDKPVSFGCPGCQGKVPIDGSKIKTTAATQPEEATAVEGGGAGAEELQHLDIPEGAVFPSGLVIGLDNAFFEELDQVLAPHGASLKRVATVDEARSVMSLSMPPLVFHLAGAVGPPPCAEIQPLLELPSDERRRCFIVLVADNLKSLDGNAAFFHGVDLILARKDAPLADRVIFAALQFRDRLAGPFIEALANVEG